MLGIKGQSTSHQALCEGAERMGLQRCRQEEIGQGQREAKEGRTGPITECSVAERARGREGSGQILGDDGSQGGGGPGVHSRGGPSGVWGMSGLSGSRCPMESGHAGQEVGVMGVRTETIRWM